MQLNFLVNCGSARGTRRTRIIVRGIIGINDFYLIKVKRDIGDSRIFINNKEQIVGAQQVFQKSRKFYRKDSVFICFDRISLRNKKREGRKIALPCFRNRRLVSVLVNPDHRDFPTYALRGHNGCRLIQRPPHDGGVDVLQYEACQLCHPALVCFVSKGGNRCRSCECQHQHQHQTQNGFPVFHIMVPPFFSWGDRFCSPWIRENENEQAQAAFQQMLLR